MCLPDHTPRHHNKLYVGLAKDGRPNNFVTFQPQKGALRITLKVDRSEETDTFLEEAGFDVDYQSRWSQYRIRLLPGEFEQHIEPITSLFEKAHVASQ